MGDATTETGQDLHPRYINITDDRLAARLSEDLINLPAEDRRAVARWFTSRGYADRARRQW
jgi:hypothetical protein